MQPKQYSESSVQAIGPADEHAGQPPMSRDDIEMSKLGKKQQMKRNFGLLSIAGITSTTMLSWELPVVGGVGITLANGGTGGYFWGSIYAFLGCLSQTLVLAEMASMIPLSGGPYNWVAMLAPKKQSKFLSYLIGWMNVIYWQTLILATSYVSCQAAQTLAAIGNPDYDVQRWHVTLIMYALLLVALLCNTWLRKVLPAIESVMLVLHCSGFLVVFVTILVLTKNKNSTSVAFGDFINSGGWSTRGISFMIGNVGPVSSLLGSDSAWHLAEEVRNASKTVPQSMLISVVLNGFLNIITVIMMIFCIGPPDEAVALYLKGEAPYAAMFHNALGSRAGEVALAAVPVCLLLLGVISTLTTSSRMLWAFAREKALPGSAWLARTRGSEGIPLNAMLATLGISFILALINVGSTSALNAFTSIVTQGYLASYIIIVCVGLHRKLAKGSDLPPAPAPAFSLGKFALPLMLISLAFSTVAFFFSFWPPSVNPDSEQFNWAVVILVVVLIIAMVYWYIKGRKEYKGPIIEIEGQEVSSLGNEVEHVTVVEKS